MKTEADNKTCPSSTCKEGALLLGVVQGDNTVALLTGTPLTVDKAFAEKLKEEGDAEKRFRFANKCVQTGCKQWTGDSCGVISRLHEMNERIEADAQLRLCNIRPTCRWFAQEGGSACTICTYVVTNNLEEV